LAEARLFSLLGEGGVRRALCLLVVCILTESGRQRAVSKRSAAGLTTDAFPSLGRPLLAVWLGDTRNASGEAGGLDQRWPLGDTTS